MGKVVDAAVEFVVAQAIGGETHLVEKGDAASAGIAELRDFLPCLVEGAGQAMISSEKLSAKDAF